MNIVIDKAIVDDLVATLAAYKEALTQIHNEFKSIKLESEANKLFGIKEVCEYLGGINPDTIIYYRKLGLPYYKKGQEGVWYRKGDIDDWLASGRVSRHSRPVGHP